MKKLKDISVRELLSIEDGFYQLETPVAYSISGGGGAVDGEISGVISVSTDTKILDGVTKVITSLADDTSYYVDNIWQDGDALEVSAMDEGTEGGGSGGDFSTAKVTVVNNSNVNVTYYIASTGNMPPDFGVDGSTFANMFLRSGESHTSDAIMYKGGASFTWDATATAKLTSIDGEYVKLADLQYIITGDCTITFS